MTSQKSSPLKNRNRAFSPFLYTFSHAFSENFIFPLLNTVWIAVMTAALPVLYTFSPSSNYELAQAMESGKTLRDLYRYVIIPDETIFVYFLILGVCLFSGLLGVFLFRFMAAKKTVNVFYSLGISRKNLFLSKYAAGSIMLAVSVVIPIFISAAVNIAYLGSCPELWKALAYYGLTLFLVGMICMTVTAAVFSSVGTVAEGIGFSVIVLFLPTIVIYCLQFLMSLLVWGSPYSANTTYNTIQYFTADGVQRFTNSLVEELTPYNPLFFMQKGMAQTAYLDAGDVQNAIQWPSFWPLLIWAAVIAVFLVIALVVFQRRKAEISGFIGKNKILNNCITFILGFGAFALTLTMLYDQIGRTASVAVGLIVYLVLYFLINLLLVRNVREVLKGAWRLPIHLVVPLAVFAIFSTGLLGYTARVPEIQDVQEIYMDADYDFSIYAEPFSGSSSAGNGGISVQSENTRLAGGLTSDRDKEMALQVHQAMISAKDEADPDAMINRSFSIVYVMKDGSTLKRHYPVTSISALEKTLALYESDWSKGRLTQLLSEEPTLAMLEQESKTPSTNSPHHYPFGYETGSVYLAGPSGDIPLELDAQQHSALKRALADDLQKQTSQQYFRPEKPQLYTLLFVQNDGSPMYPESYYSSYGSGVFPVTADMENTLRFLDENGLTDALPTEAPAFKNAYITRISDLYDGFHYYSSGLSRYFISSAYTLDRGARAYEPSDDTELSLTAEQFEAIRPNLYTRFHTGNTGYGVVVVFDGYQFSYYLPEQCATEWIKSSLNP